MRKILWNNKGNALLTAVVTFCILIIIAMCIAALSVTNVNLSVRGKQYNNTYYLAESAVQKGIQQLKDSVGDYYRDMQSVAEQVINSSADYTNDYLPKYDGFFNNVKTLAENAFSEPDFAEYGTASTVTTFSVENINTTANTADLVVESTATLPDGTQRKVRGVLNVQKQHVVILGGTTFNPAEGVLTVGGNLVFSANTSATNILFVNGGSAQVGGYVNQNDVNKKHIDVDSGKTVTVIPGLGNSIPNDLTYATLLQKRDTRPPTRYITATTPMIWSDQGSASDPRYLEGVEGLSFTVSGGSYYGQLYCRGANLTIQNGNYYGNVFCDGNVTLNGAHVNGNIVAAGDINVSGGTYGGNIVEGKLERGAFFAGGDININGGGTLVDAFVYAKDDFNMNSNPGGSAIIFAGDDINVTATNTFSYSGTMTCKGDFTLANANCWHSFNNDPDLVEAVREHDWYDTFFSTTSYVKLPVNVENIVKSEHLNEK